VGRRLRELNSRVRLVSVQPDSPLHAIEGLKHMPTAIVPGIYDPLLADEEVTVQTEDAQAMVRRVAANEGLLIGVSSGAALAAAVRLASALRTGVVVTVLPDGGERYLSDRFWEDSR
jgi:cysteine synthase B